MNNQALFWLFLAVVLGIIEAGTVNLVTLWPALAALVTALFAAAGVGTTVQSVIFIVISAVLLALTRPLAKKIMTKKTVATNADRIIGAEGVVIKRIDPVENTGQVKVMGQVWSAKSTDGRVFEEGAVVTVTALEGVKVIVEEKKEF